MSLVDKLLLRKPALIESVNDPLKDISQIEHNSPPQRRQLSGQPSGRPGGLQLPAEETLAEAAPRRARSTPRSDLASCRIHLNKLNGLQ